MRVLVTGGTGYLGQAIVRALVSRGHLPVVFARTASRHALPGEPIDGDVRDEAAVIRAAAGCDAICHTAALVSVWRPRREDFDEVNVGGLRAVLRAAREHRTPRVVYTSSFMAMPPGGYSEPVAWNDYQRTKVRAAAEAERAVAGAVPLVRVYPGVIYGPGRETEGNLVGHMVADHLAGRLPGIIGADRTWSYAYVDDVAEGHVAALERGQPGERYGLGGENVPQMRLFEIVREMTGHRLPRRIPFAAAAAIGAVEEARARLFGHSPLLTVGTARILVCDWAVDSRLSQRDLGYRITPLREGVARLLAPITTRGSGEPQRAAGKTGEALDSPAGRAGGAGQAGGGEP